MPLFIGGRSAGYAKNMPLISVIVPSYNYGHFIDKAAQSLVDQSERNWECLIVDDGSKDRTAAVAKDWARKDPRFRYFFQPNAGLSSARNLGLRHAVGEYVQFLDADDWLEPAKLSHQAHFLKENPSIGLVYGEAFYEEGSVSRAAVFSDGRPDILSALVAQNVAVVNAFLVRKSVLGEVGAFDESLAAYEDWDLWLRCALKGKSFFFVRGGEGTRARVLIHPGSMIRDRKRMLSALVQARHKISARVSDPKIRALNQKLLARDEGRLALEELKEGVTWRRLDKIIRAGLSGIKPIRGHGLIAG